jgi:hypothetical protein
MNWTLTMTQLMRLMPWNKKKGKPKKKGSVFIVVQI